MTEPTVPIETREEDTPHDEEANKYGMSRFIRTVSGLVIALGGVAFALIYPDQSTAGFIVALLGAGIVEPTMVMSALRIGGK